MHARDATFIKFRCGCGVGRVFHLGPICRRKIFVGVFLRARGYGVLEVLKGFADRVGHGDVDLIVRVIPIDGKSAVLAFRWVNCDGLIILECVEEVGGVVGGNEFYSKVIYSDVEGGR